MGALGREGPRGRRAPGYTEVDWLRAGVPQGQGFPKGGVARSIPGPRLARAEVPQGQAQVGQTGYLAPGLTRE